MVPWKPSRCAVTVKCGWKVQVHAAHAHTANGMFRGPCLSMKDREFLLTTAVLERGGKINIETICKVELPKPNPKRHAFTENCS